MGCHSDKCDGGSVVDEITARRSVRAVIIGCIADGVTRAHMISGGICDWRPCRIGDDLFTCDESAQLGLLAA